MKSILQIILTGFLLLTVLSAKTQTLHNSSPLEGSGEAFQTFLWGVKAGGPGDDKVAGIASSANNFYITGQFENQFTSKNQSAPAGSTSGIYIAKLDNKGNTDWLRTLTGDPSNNATRITSANQNILVAGTSRGTINAEKNAFTSEGQALFVSSWNDKGKIQWLGQYPFKGFATLDVLESTKQGTILIGGMFQGVLAPAGFEQNSPSDKSAYLLMLSAEGKPLKLWASSGKGSHRLVSASTASDGNRYLLFNITGDFGFGGISARETPQQMEHGLALVKTNPSGEALWIKYIPGTGYLEGIKVLAMPSGNPLVCANYTGKVALNDTIMGTNSYMASALWLFSADGTLKKKHILSSPVTVRALDAMFAPNGNILITGYFRQEYDSPKGTVKSKLSFGDILLLQTDTLLAQVWHDEPGEDAFSFGKAFTLDQTGNIVLAGGFSGKLDLRGQRLESAGGNDILIAKYYNCLQKKAMITGDPFVCEGGKTELKVTGDYATYLWNGQWGQSSLTVVEPGIFTVMAYDKTGCAAADTIEVKALPKPDLGLPSTVTVSLGKPVLLTAAEGFTSYRWGDGLTSRQREVEYNSKQTQLNLTVSAISSAGCKTSDTINVKFVKAESTISESTTYLRAWPNPVEEKLWWYLDVPIGNTVSVQLCDEKGSTAYLTELKDYTTRSVQTIDMARLTPGSYVLSLRVAGQTFIQKIMKK
jgi:hypothetical protein